MRDINTKRKPNNLPLYGPVSVFARGSARYNLADEHPLAELMESERQRIRKLPTTPREMARYDLYSFMTDFEMLPNYTKIRKYPDLDWFVDHVSYSIVKGETPYTGRNRLRVEDFWVVPRYDEVRPLTTQNLRDWLVRKVPGIRLPEPR